MQQVLELGEILFDRIKLGTVGRKIQDPRAHRLDGFAHAGDLVGLLVVEDDGVPGSQHRDEVVGDVAAEAGAIGGAIDETERAQAGGTQSGGDGGRFVMMGWTPPDGIDVPGWWC